ncbi:PDZ domain-containing protein [Lacinutrix neustonica]|uniref:PDZ domain-containing protein n=1 Tax=Lacinutrix neustonica TaxID=2980107 RepID=A0A9E8N0W9_9FLAO|nr:PDZ domain-containing protein [Lacinutrix neustonica]WAC03824.1 PDZ domain-containing protein [Lacinutrix neustonica]
MKKITLLFLLILSQSTFGQVEFTETKKLAATCKVWGVLKYYHPKVANGIYHWDNQLFDVLPKIEQAKTKEAFSLVLEDWINSLGEVEAIAPIMLSEDIDYFEKNFDLSWIDKNDLFSNNLSRALKFIENNRFQGNQNYVHQRKAGNIFVKNEDYSAYDFNDKNSRLLALFMYWNLMEYFYPYKYVMDKDWDSTLEDMIPLFIEANNDDDFYLAMQKLTVRLNDSHVVFHRYLGKGTKTKRFLPVTCKIIEEKIIVTEVLQVALTEKEDIKVGDVITKVNGKSIKEIILENRDFISASNEAYYLEHILEPVLSGYSETITLEFLKEGMTTSKTIDWNDYNIWQRWELNQASKLKINLNV